MYVSSPAFSNDGLSQNVPKGLVQTVLGIDIVISRLLTNCVGLFAPDGVQGAAGANAYITAPGSKGFPLHFDNVHVFLMQARPAHTHAHTHAHMHAHAHARAHT